MQTHTLHTESKTTTAKPGRFFGKGEAMPFFQPKLTVNTPGDAHEQEADRVADQVMRMREGDAPVVQRMPLTPVSIQRKCAECEQEVQRKEDEQPEEQEAPVQRMATAGGAAAPSDEEEQVQRKCTNCEKEEKEQVQRKETGGGDAGGHAAPSIVSDVLSSGGGQPMEGGTRQFMESRFGQDFSQVRIHTDSRAAESASSIQARAYTSGSNIVFGKGEYQPSTSEGQRLLAHELAHVGQQGASVKRQQQPSLITNLQRLLNIYGPIDYNNVIATIRAASIADRQAAMADAGLRSLINTRIGATYSVLVYSHLLEGSMHWRNPTNNNFYQYFVTNRGNGTLSNTSTMNCWESILYAAHLAGKIDGNWIRTFYNNAMNSGGDPNVVIWRQLGWVSSLPVYTTSSSFPAEGQLVFYSSRGSTYPGHVAVSLGGGYVMSLWNQPNNIYQLQRIHISTLSGTIQYGNPTW